MAKPITATLGTERYPFLCQLGELRQIQDACGAGPPVVAARLARCVQLQRENPSATVLELAAMGLGDWRIDDVREPILTGLIAGGMAPSAAGKLVRRWIDDRGFKGLVENAATALNVLLLGVEEPEGDEAGEPQAGAESPTPTSAS